MPDASSAEYAGSRRDTPPAAHCTRLAAIYNAGVIARLRLYFRRSVRIALLTLHLLSGMLLAAAALPVLRVGQRDRVIRWWANRLLRVLGVRVQTAMPPSLPGGALLVCNHVSWLDIYLILASCRVHFVSKSEVRRWPVVGWLAHRTGTLFLERGRRADTARINAEMTALLRQGRWVAMFPEGTTSDGRGLRRYLPSLLQPAVALDCPVVPAALRYRDLDGRYSAAPAYVDDISLWNSLKRIVDEPGLVAELHFGPPIQPDGHRRTLAASAEAATARLLGLAPADSSPQTSVDPPAAPQ